MARKVKHPEHVNHERWLVSYADFITLLFATFTMLFAISNVEKSKLVQAAQSMNKAFGGGPTIAVPSIITPNVVAQGSGAANSTFNLTIIPGVPSRSHSDGTTKDDEDENTKENLVQQGAIIKATNQGQGKNEGRGPGNGGGTQDKTANGTPARDNEQPTSQSATGTPTTGTQSVGRSEGHGDAAMAAKIEALMENLGLKGKVDVRQENRGTVISLGAAAFFDQGEVDVKLTSTYQLDKIVNALRDQNFEIRVEGHTDNTPVTSGRYTSNLELSTLRAAHIVDFMIKNYHYPPQLLSSAGYGEYRPIASNDTPEGREKNRRVDIVILNQRMRALEPQAAPQGVAQ